MIMYSTGGHFLQHFQTTDKTFLKQIVYCQGIGAVGFGMLVLSEGKSSCHLLFTSSSIKNTTDICSWNNSYISQVLCRVKEKRKLRLGFTVPEFLYKQKGGGVTEQSK